MPVTLESIVPWGRSFAEYQAMFALTDADLAGKILGCGDGPASFHAEARQQGIDVVSIDPIYQFQPDEIRKRVEATYTIIMDEVRKNESDFVWEMFRNPEGLGTARLTAMERFVTDLQRQHENHGYCTATLPHLPFPDAHFQIALCSHLLFLYSKQFSLEFHLEAILEMCRVAHEVRIFPLFDLSINESVHVEPVSKMLREQGFEVRCIVVTYEFQRGANEMLRIAPISSSA